MQREKVGYPALAAALSCLGAVQALSTGRGPLWTAAVLLGTAAVGPARRRPLVPAGGLLLSIGGQVAASGGDPAFASFLVLLVTAYAAGRRSSRGQLAGVLGLVCVSVGLVIAADPTLQRPVEPVFPLVYTAGAAGLGRLVSARERAAQEAAAGAQREALADERARIAREMHDVVAHSVSLLVVQAESAAAVLDRDPERARAQLERVATSGRQALEELRRLLGVLQPGAGAEAHPQPSLSDLPALRDAVQAAGPQVRLHVDDAARDAAPGVQLTAYRVVQEALTNAVRHGHASSVDVDVRRVGDALELDVRDDGAGSTAGESDGHGLRGMRERVQLYDGMLEAGPAADGGFRVRARLPAAP